MNISTGGPHILLFERDQQLAGLLMSECQLAGYECHAARTAVEVFDAIARQPIRLVLVNLAQAAAARREFWVALDTQRRGRGVQVLTFRCTNLAGYGPHDPEDRSNNAVADVEIDGMLGIVNLIDVLRTRLPGNNTSISSLSNQKINTGTMPRIPKTTTPPPPSSHMGSSRGPSHSSIIHNILAANSTSSRSPVQAEPVQPVQPVQSASWASPDPQPQSPAHPLGGSMLSAEVSSSPDNYQPNYSDKIRAVLYPNQRTWTHQGNNTLPTPQENRTTQDYQTLPSAPSYNSPEATALQRLANGQVGLDSASESGLAQLSRLLQERQSFTSDTAMPSNTSYSSTNPQTPDNDLFADIPYQSARHSISDPSASANTPYQAAKHSAFDPSASVNTSYPAARPTLSDPSASANTSHQSARLSSLDPSVSANTPYQPTRPLSDASSQPHASYQAAKPLEEEQAFFVRNTPKNASATNVDPLNYVPNITPFTPSPAQEAENNATISTQPLRASPIQDMPAERAVSGPSGTDGHRRPDVLSRTNYSQQSSTTTVQPLASIATPTPTPVTSSPAHIPAPPPPPSSAPQEKLVEPPAIQNSPVVPPVPQSAPEEEIGEFEKRGEVTRPVAVEGPENTVRESNDQSSLKEQLHEIKNMAANQTVNKDADMTSNNAMLLDIMQSLPPMPPPQPQPPQSPVLSGRATRSLGSVLLEGHLVPQSRLEVAQHIQRMLRGVDLNYQLGEILLMFKLLTPDQLLAASLVSYGLITTTQISALGRIRQELHSIGLEYDLENLLILFRILTPEQLREVRASWQS